MRYRAFPSSKISHFWNATKCKTFLVKMSFIGMKKKPFSYQLNLALKDRLGANRKWPFANMNSPTNRLNISLCRYPRMKEAGFSNNWWANESLFLKKKTNIQLAKRNVVIFDNYRIKNLTDQGHSPRSEFLPFFGSASYFACSRL